MATQIELLRPQDELAVVLFDDQVKVEVAPTKMDAHGVIAAKTVLPKITNRGGTNIWAGLLKALTLAEKHTDKNVAIILQTDGESDPSLNPPRGIVAAFRSWLDTHPTVRLSLHTVGYGYGDALDMPLLRQLAEVAHGTVNYIPDASMVGTVFIHLMANIMSSVYRGAVLQVPEHGVLVPLGFLQGGQTRDVIITCPDTPFEISVAAYNSSDVFTLHVASDCATGPASLEVARQLFIDALAVALDSGRDAALKDVYERLQSLAAADPRVTALLTDLRHADANKGQIGKAFDADNFTRWGRHFLPGVLCGHRAQWAINFKDQGSTLYGGATTKSLIDHGDALFNNLPPPKPSIAAHSPSGSRRAAAPVVMSSINNRYGGCFLGSSTVLMADGARVRVDELCAGQRVHGGAAITCVVVTAVPAADIVFLGDDSAGGFTPWHPVLVGGAWHFPADLAPVQRVATDAVYNVVLEAGHMVVVNGVPACTLAHGFTGPVVGHPYFGARVPGHRHVLDDLAASPGFAEGRVVLSNVVVHRNADTGFIDAVTPAAKRAPVPAAADADAAPAL